MIVGRTQNPPPVLPAREVNERLEQRGRKRDVGERDQCPLKITATRKVVPVIRGVSRGDAGRGIEDRRSGRAVHGENPEEDKRKSGILPVEPDAWLKVSATLFRAQEQALTLG